MVEIIFNNNGFVFQFSELSREFSPVLAMTEELQNQLQTSGLEEVKDKTTRLKGKESER